MHEMGGFDREIDAVFNISDDYEVGIMIARVYQNSHKRLPERYRQKSDFLRERKRMSDIAFLEESGNGIILLDKKNRILKF